MMNRSLRTDVRNPLLALRAMQVLQTLPANHRTLLRNLLDEIASEAKFKAEKCWKQHKAPMATYWKAVAVYAGHTRRALRDDAKGKKGKAA